MIPENIIKVLEKELETLSFGSAALEIQVHDGKARYRIIKTISMVPGKPTSGSTEDVQRGTA